MNKYYNIEEQRYWNADNWIAAGHEWSGPFGTTEKLWNQHIFPHIKSFRNKKILEIAPGHGRITQFLSILASELTVVDLNENCIRVTKEKLGDHVNRYIVNDGLSLTGIKDESQDLVFSFDSFVHMHSNVVQEYVKEISRVLVPSGGGFIHHSWFFGGEEESFKNVAGRANMSPEIFKSFLQNSGMEIVVQVPIQFSLTTDYISIFKKI